MKINQINYSNLVCYNLKDQTNCNFHVVIKNIIFNYVYTSVIKHVPIIYVRLFVWNQIDKDVSI